MDAGSRGRRQLRTRPRPPVARRAVAGPPIVMVTSIVVTWRVSGLMLLGWLGVVLVFWERFIGGAR